MIQLLDTLRPFGFNSRRLREKDLLELCDRLGIFVTGGRIATSFYIDPGIPHIAIPDHFQGVRREFALAHEITHFFHSGHPVGKMFFMGIENTKEELEADAMASIALIPYSEIDSPTILDEYPLRFAKEVAVRRRKIAVEFGC